MQQAVVEQGRYEIRDPGLPLAVYREVSTHLRQVEGVEVGLLPQTASFDYAQSQVGGLWIQYGDATSLEHRERVNQILAYYQKRYGAFGVES